MATKDQKSNTTLRIGTRGSELALTQTRHILGLLAGKNVEAKEKVIVTQGDQDARPFRDLMGDGFFTKEIEQELAEDQIQLAVHSAKDLPSMVHEHLPWMAVGEREQARDLLVAKKETLDQLDAANFFEVDSKVKTTSLARVRLGTSSPRRLAQARLRSSDLHVVQLRGNVPTRLQKVAKGEVDAIVIAQAGVNRLGGARLIQELGLEARVLNWTTAPCQGIIAVQANRKAQGALDLIADPHLDLVAKAEKSLLALLGGGCQLPLGAHIRVLRDSKVARYHLDLFYFDGKNAFEFELEDARLSDLLREAFARLAGLPAGVHDRKRVWLTGPLQHLLKPAQLLVAKGLVPVAWPLIEIRPNWDSQKLQTQLKTWQSFGAVAFGSSFGARLFLTEFASKLSDPNDLTKVPMFAVGAATAEPLLRAGLTVEAVKDTRSAKALALEMQKRKIQGKILIPGTMDSRLRDELKSYELDCEILELYRSIASVHPLTSEFPAVKSGDSMILTSPSGAQEYRRQISQNPDLKALKVFAFGPSTSQTLTQMNIEHQTNSRSGHWDEMMDLISGRP